MEKTMKNKRRKRFFAIILTPVFVFWGFYFYDDFFDLVVGSLDSVSVQITNFNSPLDAAIVFASSIGILPILMFVSDLGVMYEKSWKFISTVAFTLFMGCLFVFFRISYINSYAVSELNLPGIRFSIQLENVQAGWYLGLGFMFGMLTSTIFFMFFGKSEEE